MGNRININFEILLILIFSGLFLFLALAEPWEHKIAHPFPYSYLASDAFFHQATTQYIKEQGTVTNTPPYTVGGYEGVVDAHPPMLFQLTSALSILSGINVYDSIMIIAVFSFLFAILMAYLIWRQANRSIAMLALPICILMLNRTLIPLIFWGYWLLLTGILFMIASLWAISKFDLKYSYMAITFFLSATALAHQPEFIYAGLFFAGFLLIKVIKEKRLDEKLIKKTVIICSLTAFLSFYSLLIFSKTFMQTEGYRGAWDIEVARGGYPAFNIINLGIMGIIVLIGIALFLISKKKKLTMPASISIYGFLLGYLIYLGMGKRAYAHRLFWIIYLSFFFGFAIYYLLRLTIKKIHIIYPFILALIILFISARGIYGTTRIGPGIMNQYDWDGLNWISENLPEDAWVYYFYSDALSHNAPLYNSRRIAFNIRLPQFIEGIQAQEIRKSYIFGLADGYPTYLHKTGPFNFCYYSHELKPKNGSFECLDQFKSTINVPIEDRQKDICSIEYYYFNKASREPVLAQYNLAIISFLLENDWIEEIYSNGLVSILKNNKPGVDCFGNNAE